MDFEEKLIGAFKIYTGAIEQLEGGYLASVIVHQVRGEHAPTMVFRNSTLNHGYRYSTSRAALDAAMEVGEREVLYRTFARAA